MESESLLEKHVALVVSAALSLLFALKVLAVSRGSLVTARVLLTRANLAQTLVATLVQIVPIVLGIVATIYLGARFRTDAADPELLSIEGAVRWGLLLATFGVMFFLVPWIFLISIAIGLIFIRFDPMRISPPTPDPDASPEVVMKEHDSRRRRASNAAAIMIGGIVIVFVGLWFVSYAPTPWMSAQRFRIASRHYLIGYEIDSDSRDAYVMTEKSRRVVVVPLRAIRSHSFCSLPAERSQETVSDLLSPNPRAEYPACFPDD